MRRLTILVAVFGILGSAASADVLIYSSGGKREGALDEFTLAVGGMPRIYIRDDVKTITVSKTGKDVVKLQDDSTVEGKLGSVRFKLTEGTMVIARKDLRSIEVTAGTKVEEWKPPSDKPKEPVEEETPKLTAEQQQALAKNKELYDAYAEKAEEQRKKDIESFSRKYKSEWDKTVREISSYEKRIQDKIRRRETASRRYQSESRYRSDYDRLMQTDQLDQDRQILEKSKKKYSSMKKMLKKGRDEIDEAGELRVKRVASVAKGIRGDVLSGKAPNEEQMTRRYDAALKIATKSTKKK